MSHIDDLISEWDTLDATTKTRLVSEARDRNAAENTAAQAEEIRARAVAAVERNRRANDLDDIENITRLLVANLDVIAGAAWAPDMVVEIREAITDITRKIDTPPGRVYAGTCNGVGLIGPDGVTYPADPDNPPCDRELHIPEEGRHEKATVRCPDCGATYSLAIRQQWVIEQYAGMLVTATEGAALMSIPKKTIYTWSRRKRIIPRPDGRFLLDELVELARTRKDDAA